MSNFKRKYKPSLIMAGILKESFTFPILSFMSVGFLLFALAF